MARSICRGLVGTALFLIWLSWPSTAAQASSQPMLTVQPTAGPVGTAVTVNLASSRCGQVVFEATAAGGGSALGSFGNVNGPTHESVEIPSFVGTDQTEPVTSGNYRFAVSCTTSAGSTDFTTVTAAFRVTSPALPASRFVGMARAPNGGGYWLVQAGGGVYSFGDAGFHGSLPGIGVVAQSPIVGISSTPDGAGYWLVAADGGVFAFGDAKFYGSLPGMHIAPEAPIVGIVAAADGGGYWLLGADGGQFAFGDSPYCGRPVFVTSAVTYTPGYVHGNSPYVGMAANPRSLGAVGFDEVTSVGYGSAFPEAGATCRPSPGNEDDFALNLQAPQAQISGIATASADEGPWLVGIDGGVFALPLGNAPAPPFYGSLPSVGVSPVAPIVGITATPDGGGYWLLGADGGVFAFGNANFYGSAAP